MRVRLSLLGKVGLLQQDMLSLNKSDFMTWKSLVLANACALRDRLNFIILTNKVGFVVYGF